MPPRRQRRANPLTAGLFLLVAALLLAFPGCGGDINTPGNIDANADTSATDDRAGWPETLRFGFVPVEGGADTTQRYAPLEQHLGDRLGIPVQVVSASSYQGVITAMENDQIEFAWLGPKSYVEAARRADAQALLLELNLQGERGYRATFLVPADSDIQSLQDARGKRFAFTDPNSTSGYLMPSIILLDELGETPETFFGEVSFSGAHGTSILQAANGEIDIVATNDLDIGKLIENGTLNENDVRVVYTSELIPGAPIAARRELPESFKQAVVDAILELNDKPELQERFQNGGYVHIQDEAYDIIRAAEDYLAAQQ